MQINILMKDICLEDAPLIQVAVIYLLERLNVASREIATKVPDNSKLIIQVEDFCADRYRYLDKPDPKGSLNVQYLVRHVCPNIGSFATRIVYNREYRENPTLFILNGNELDNYKLFETIFGQALEEMLRKGC